MARCRHTQCKVEGDRWLFGRFHAFLLSKSRGYHQWHLHPRREITHWGVLSVHLFLILALATNMWSVPAALAGSQEFSFSTANDYSYDDTTLEVTGTSARLKSQQYTGSEANTSALWHFDESEGGSAETTAEDSHPSNNNDITFSTTSPCDSDGGEFESGKINNALVLNGVPNCVTAADSASLSVNGVNPSLTIEALVKFPEVFDADADIRKSILDKGNYRMYFSESDGKLKFELHDSATKTWNKVGGSNTTNLLTTEGLNDGWRQLIPGTVFNLVEYNNALYIGTSTTVANAGGAEVWKYSGSGTAWTKVAGDGLLNDQKDNVTFEGGMSRVLYNSKL